MNDWMNLEVVVDLVREQGVWAYVEQTGGSCATIYAGARHIAADDGREMYAAVAGPGEYGWGRGPSIGYYTEFFIGADDLAQNPVVTDAAKVGARCPQVIADLIVAQSRLKLGKALSPRRAARIVRAHEDGPTRAERFVARLREIAGIPLHGASATTCDPKCWHRSGKTNHQLMTARNDTAL